jgi:hypothetical protein
VGANRIQQAIADKQEAARYHEAMYLAVGRTLRVAQEFEQNARFVTWAARAHANVQKATEDGVSELWQVLTSTSYLGLIGPTLKVLEGLNVFDAEYMAVLGHAKEARNSIAHEAALFADHSTSLMGEHAAKLIMWVDAVQAADIRLSKAAYDIQEPKDPLPLWNFEQIAGHRRQTIATGLTQILGLAKR